MTTQTVNASPEAPQESALHRFLEGFGAPFVMIGKEIWEIAFTFALTIYYTIFYPIRWKEVLRQCFLMGNRSLFFVSVVMGFFGLIMVMQTVIQANKIIGDLTYIGVLYLQLLLREMGPTITAALIAIRVGTGLAAEIGSMVVTEQVDALRMNDADPIQYLIVPRMIGCVFMAIVLTVIASFSSYVWSAAGAYFIFDINPHTYINFSGVKGSDVIVFFMKTVAYAIIIPVIGCHAGLAAHGGSEGVGLATTRAVINATLGLVLTDFFLTAVAYVFFY